jgi:UDP-N-acetylmuramyl pentapeptide phosphotransferase/UDP-N-acetylglucosamine-1-phosphate transferase
MPVSEFFQLGLIVFGASFAACLVIVLSQKWHGSLSHDHDLDGVQKVHMAAVPRIGGVGVAAGLLLGSLAHGAGLRETFLLLAASRRPSLPAWPKTSRSACR